MSSDSDFPVLHRKCLGCPALGDLGRWYECVVCGTQITLCGPCFDLGKNRVSPKHKYYHPMRALYNKKMADIYFGGEVLVNGEAPQSFQCPFCDDMGFTAEELAVHVQEKHSNHPDASALIEILETMSNGYMGSFGGARAHHLAMEEQPLGGLQVPMDEEEDTKSTEIRCQEKSRGGLSYEVILAEPAPNVAVPKRPVTPGKNVSVEEIEQKLKAAEERRISLEAKKMADISTKLAKVDEATRKKDEITNEFITQTKEQLESKMEQHVEKREAIISDMKEKLKIHAQEIEKTRETLEQQKANEQKAIEEKLKIAQTLRDENIKKMLNRLKEHERRAELVRQNKAQTQDMDGQQNAIASSG
ncbi:E3 ubiquitin-protein ligase KCMF1 isoform X2 [Drosophila pseudoobscura]|uniref:E3 ubiquitin-protein ligase KCMF1 isoform X2 n=1 Tax=Drosophila pseudoobscura pseudoobscura TaxID=46245 RepID=A0A6I8V754_DROPS|nr:E3 ubiquitin-protein ligase KCMF1 isoform X2 [Drosophila pseudoobscura]